MTKELSRVQKAILKNLFIHKYIGKRHTSEDNAVKGFPTHEIKRVKKELNHQLFQPQKPQTKFISCFKSGI